MAEVYPRIFLHSSTWFIIETTSQILMHGGLVSNIVRKWFLLHQFFVTSTWYEGVIGLSQFFWRKYIKIEITLQSENFITSFRFSLNNLM